MDMPELCPLKRIHQRPDRTRDDVIDRWSIGDEIISPAHGIIVDLQHDAVTIARRNESGRYMEIVFVGEAIRQLRRA